MNRFLIALLLTAGYLTSADQPPKAEDILDHYIEVTGGKAKYEAIHSELTKGTMEVAGRGIKGTIANYEAEPNKTFSVAELEGVGKIESGSDGDVAWEKSAIAGPRIKTDAEREETLRASFFNPHLNWRKLYEKSELTGSETVEGEDCYKIVLTPKAGNPITEYFSKKSGLLVKTTGVHPTQMGDISADSFLKDYKDVAGILVPFTLINKFAGQEIQVHVESVTFNPEIPKDRFDLPDDIKALLRKNGTTNAK